MRVLAALVKANTVMHVRGTRGSGKSCLAQSLYYHLRSQKKKTILFLGWHSESPAEDFLASACQGRGWSVTRDNVGDSDVTFIIDEAQTSYNDSELWAGMMKFQSLRKFGAQFCLFSAYGSAVTGPSPNYQQFIPLYFTPNQRMSLTTSPNEASPEISLFYNTSEYTDIINRYCGQGTVEFEMAHDIRDYVFLLGNGHPGATASVLDYIRKVR